MAASSIAGDYEYIKGKESKQTLKLNANGTCEYTEVGETGIEKWNAQGSGTWKVNGEVVQIVLGELVKTMEFKIQTMVKGIEDGTSRRSNVGIPITVKELVNAPKGFGAHKWRHPA
jgi:hypothetical protein